MTRSKRIGKISKLALDKEHAAARDLAQLREQLMNQENRLAELKSYRDEYNINFNDTAKHGVNMRSITEFHAFLSKLNDAILQQSQLVDNARMAFCKAKSAWMASHNHRRALDHVSERFRESENTEQQRKEQKENDEFAQRRPHKK